MWSYPQWMLDPSRIKSKDLRRLLTKGEAQGIRADWRRKVEKILGALNVMTSPVELNIPGYGFHELKGDRKGTFSVTVSRNWRITFKWDEHGPYDVDLEDYHG